MLVNEIAANKHCSVLVLGDCQGSTTPAIHDGLNFLIEHEPPRMRLVIASRDDQFLP